VGVEIQSEGEVVFIRIESPIKAATAASGRNR
jgi:hypothetical protein